MKIVIIGASGFTGSAITHEAIERGHDATALVTNPAKVSPAPRLTVRRIDVLETEALANAILGHDAVISAFSGHAQQDVLGYYLQGIRSIIAACKRAEIPRLLVVGGAGSLKLPDGTQLLDTSSFPAEWRASAEGARQALQLLREEPTLNWTFLSPAAYLIPGERTGRFRIGRDELLIGPNGKSEISTVDYAKAMIDELEIPAHPRMRFTVGY